MFDVKLHNNWLVYFYCYFNGNSANFNAQVKVSQILLNFIMSSIMVNLCNKMDVPKKCRKRRNNIIIFTWFSCHVPSNSTEDWIIWQCIITIAKYVVCSVYICNGLFEIYNVIDCGLQYCGNCIYIRVQYT